RQLVRWLREHLAGHLQVTYQGVTEPLGAVLAQLRSTASHTLEEMLALVASHLLVPDFRERYVDYPTFVHLSRPITESSRPASAMEAVRFLAGRGRTSLAMGVLEGLALVDDEGNVRPYGSPFARRYLDLLHVKAQGQVVNRGEVIEQIAGGLQPVEKGLFFRLEPEWVVVVLLALVYNGDIVLNLGGREELDAGSIERAATMALADLIDFRFYKQPRTLPVNLWATIFEGLGLAPGLIRDENTRARALGEHLLPTVGAELERAARIHGQLQQGIQVWNASLFTDRFTLEVEAGTVVGSDRPAVTFSLTTLLPHLRGYKQFLETLSRFNTVGKLRNLRLTLQEIADALADRDVVDRTAHLLDLVGRIQPVAAYLAEARANLPDDHPWVERTDAARQALLADLRRLGNGESEIDTLARTRELDTLKADYVAAYAGLHHQLVLGPQADDRRLRLYDDPRLAALDALVEIDLLALNRAELDGWKHSIAALRPCRGFHEGLLTDSPTCPVCHLRPVQAGHGDVEATIGQLDERLDDILLRWQQALRAALTSDAAQKSLGAMTAAERMPIDMFLDQGDTDPRVPPGLARAATQALHGIEALTLPVEALIAALKDGGLPCTRDELQARFRQFVQTQMRGHDEGSTRLTLDR
ncbi:MAG: hypothetical protein JW934_15350, partial [Anaerolineae bacterium]|nr:hypothetical protein [Anaerolineae bacterium]